jgi:hypothetical protein
MFGALAAQIAALCCIILNAFIHVCTDRSRLILYFWKIYLHLSEVAAETPAPLFPAPMLARLRALHLQEVEHDTATPAAAATTALNTSQRSNRPSQGNGNTAHSMVVMQSHH